MEAHKKCQAVGAGTDAESIQGNLGFVYKMAATSTDALKSVAPAPKAKGRKKAIENHLLMAGADGLTRHELAELMEIQLFSVCGLVRVMLDAGTLTAPGTKRETPTGQKAKVVVLARCDRKHIPGVKHVGEVATHVLECRGLVAEMEVNHGS